MTIRATADTKFIRKYLFLAAAGLGFFLWGAYDEFVKFPLELEMARAFDPFHDQPDAVQKWAELYEQHKDRGWHREKPHNRAATVEGYIRFNRFIIFGGLALMGYFLIKYFRVKNAWMESTENGITTSWGKSLEFANITQINKKRWEAKGIAKVTYKDQAGVERSMVFDDFKFLREPMADLMSMCEQGLEPEQIIGGKSQAEIKAEKLAAVPEA
jgi:hypothetical protein